MSISEEIKQRLDIAAVISEHVHLDKTGRNLRGLCPFHTEKTPSFFVFPERQTWKCFGCGAGGDVVSFVMKKEGMEFGEALKTLAQRAGVAMPERARQSQTDSHEPKLYRMNEAAAAYYHRLLLESDAAATAREYVEKRGLNAEIVAEFQLGFSLNEWESLKTHLKGEGFGEKELVAGGLLSEKGDRSYDRFRGRLMYPICNIKGQVVGFGARALDDAMPKYLNSSESPIFKKSDMLYAMDRAKQAIREQGKVVIVEGYMDVLTAHQHGFKNVVASMGTALTEHQVSVLKTLSTDICLALDADAAGSAATLRGIDVCRKTLSQGVEGMKGWLGKSTALGANITVLSLSEGKDPDEVIRLNPEGWQQLIDTAEPLMDYLLSVMARDHDLASAEGKSRFSDQVLPIIAEMADSAVREAYLTKLSKLVGVSERVLAAKLAVRFDKKELRKNKGKAAPAFRYTQKTGDQLEEHCLYLLLNYSGLDEMAHDLDPDYFERIENREIFVAWRSCGSGVDLTESIDIELQDHLQHLIDSPWPKLDARGQEKAMRDCVCRMEARSRQAALAAEKDIEENSARLKELWQQLASLS